MNKYEEALKILNGEENEEGLLKMAYALNIAREAIEKQIEKEIVYLPKEAICQYPHCPACNGNLYDWHLRTGFCECGQSLKN